MKSPVIPTFLAILVATCAPLAPAAADLITVDILNGAEPGAPTPPGILTLDIFVDMDTTDAWTAAGIRAIASSGATIRYGGPNVVLNPGLTGNPDRNVVMLSKPLARDSLDRFFASGAALGGRFSPTGPTAETTSTELNVVFFANPPATSTTPSTDGYIARIALDVSALNSPNDAFAIFTPGNQPAGAIPVLLSTAPGQPGGTVIQSFDNPVTRGINWGVYLVPAPTTTSLLAAAGILAPRRRRSAN